MSSIKALGLEFKIQTNTNHGVVVTGELPAIESEEVDIGDDKFIFFGADSDKILMFNSECIVFRVVDMRVIGVGVAVGETGAAA